MASSARSKSWSLIRRSSPETTIPSPAASRFQIPSGTYYLTHGSRNVQGEPFVRLFPFTLKPGGVLEVSGPLDLPAR